MGQFLSRDEIRAAKDLETASVEVPEWGGFVLVRGMTGRERDDLEASMRDVDAQHRTVKMTTENFRAKLVALCAVDEQGERLFSLEDVYWLGEKSAAALSRVADRIVEMSAMSAGDVQVLLKN